MMGRNIDRLASGTSWRMNELATGRMGDNGGFGPFCTARKSEGRGVKSCCVQVFRIAGQAGLKVRSLIASIL